MSEQYKKFGELSRAEQLELVEHVLDGGEVEALIGDTWSNPDLKGLDCLYFHNKYPTRKAKSELELLKEQRGKLDEKIKKIEGIHFGDFVKKREHTLQGKVYKVFESSLYKDFPYKIGESFYSKEQVNHQFIKVQ